MTISVSSPITGASQTGLTSPTFTLTSDTAPNANSKQYAVTALGGTQTGVDTHSVSKPFTITVYRPQTLRVLGTPNPVTGVVTSVPRNVYGVLTRKGVSPLSGQPNAVMLIRTSIEVPAGSDTVEPEDIRAALSAHIGALSQTSSGIGDTAVSGVL
jgi:hypothetical protein